MKKIVFFFIISLRAFAFLDVAEVEKSVDAYYPVILSNLKELESSYALRESAQGNFDTNLSIEGNSKQRTLGDQDVFSSRLEGKTRLMGLAWETGFSSGSGYFPSYEGDRKTFSSGELFASLKLPLLKNFLIDKERTQLNKAKIEVEKSEQDFKYRRLEILLDAKIAYWNWVKACLKYQVFEKLLENSLVRKSNLSSRVKKGDVANVVSLDNDRLILKRKSYLAASEQEINNSALILSLFLRTEDGKPRLVLKEETPTNLEIRDYKKFLEKIVSEGLQPNEHPAVKKDKIALDKVKLEKSLAKNQILPNLNFKTELNRNFGANRSNVSQDEFKAGVLFSIPLQNRQASGQHSFFKFQEKRFDYELQLAQEKLKANQENAKIKLKMTFERQLLAKQELDLNKTLEQAENKRFQMGDSDLINVNIREESTADSQSRFIEEQVEYQKAISYLYYVYGLDS